MRLSSGVSGSIHAKAEFDRGVSMPFCGSGSEDKTDGLASVWCPGSRSSKYKA